jgi:hypothetical protein
MIKQVSLGLRFRCQGLVDGTSKSSATELVSAEEGLCSFTYSSHSRTDTLWE